MSNIKISKISKISPSRILDKCNSVNNLAINHLGISNKYTGENITISLLGSGLPSHELVPKDSVFENFTSEKDPIIDVINFSTVGTGLLSSESFGLLPGAEILHPKIIDNKGNIFLSSVLSGLLWSCIKHVNIIILPCSLQNNFLSSLSDTLKKVNDLGIIVIMPLNKGEENLDILKTNYVLGVKVISSKDNLLSIKEEKKNLMTMHYPKNLKIFSTFGVNKFSRLLAKESSPFILASIVGSIYSRRKNKKLSLAYKNIYTDLNSLKAL